MSRRITRRQFVSTSAAAAGLMTTAPGVFGQAPAVRGSGAKPVVVASSNGNRFKNGGPVTGVQKAFEMMTSGGADVLEALIAGVNLCELDPEESGVGYGGLPNAEGVVQLDSCCMHGPKKRACGVASLDGVRAPSLVAKAVMEYTDHHLLVGKDAQRFAKSMGFTIEDDLNTEKSRKTWLEWKRRSDPEHYLDPTKRTTGASSDAALNDAGYRAALSMMRDGLIDPDHFWGTINCDGVNARGEVCGVTTTSGLAWKIPGRVGDSPILGAGLYVDNGVGAAGSTGRGEANLYNLSSYLIVENMRRGMSPKDAGLDALRRVKSNTIEKRLLNSTGNPNFGLSFYIVNAKGEYAGVSMYPGKYAVCTERGPETLDTEPLLNGKPTD
jgi:N4-(beta-N-acetylglucosaminyl)-L-asparaginase